MSAFATSLFWWFASKPRNANKVFGDMLLAVEFSPYSQPLVDSQSGEWTYTEVLARWNHGT